MFFLKLRFYGLIQKLIWKCICHHAGGFRDTECKNSAPRLMLILRSLKISWCLTLCYLCFWDELLLERSTDLLVLEVGR